jgi:hypothetical protein
MQDQLSAIQQEALSSLDQVQDDDGLQRWKVAYLGRSAPLMQTFDKLGTLPKEEPTKPKACARLLCSARCKPSAWM